MAAAEQAEAPGNDQYQGTHMDAIFKEGFSFSGFERDHLALNLGNKQFLDISGVSGLDSISDGRGSVFADLDNDGDTDVFLTAVQREAHFLFRNNIGNSNNFLRVELQGTDSGRDAFGAVVRVKTSAGVLTKVKAGGSGYLSQHDPRLLFGLGQDESADWVEVTWPGGKKQRVESVAAGRSMRIVEGQGGVVEIAERRFSLVDPLTAAETKIAQIGLATDQAFPDIALQSLDDEPLALSSLVRPGKRYLVNFWATHCVPCATEMPELQQLQAALGESGIELLGINIDIETLEHVPEFLSSYGISYPIYSAPAESVSSVFPRGEVQIPMSFLLDDQLNVVDVFSGWSPASRRAIHALIEDPREGG